MTFVEILSIFILNMESVGLILLFLGISFHVLEVVYLYYSLYGIRAKKILEIKKKKSISQFFYYN